MQEANYILLETQQKCIGSDIRVRGVVKDAVGFSGGKTPIRGRVKRQRMYEKTE